MKKTNHSLYSILALTVSTIIISVMTLSLSYNYFDTKNKLIADLGVDSQTILVRLQKSILPFVESYSINEYEKLILNEMNDKNIFAIVVEDYNMGTILGTKTFTTGKIRDENWKVKEYQLSKIDTNSLDNSFFTQEAFVTTFDDKHLATINIYFTDKFIQLELSALIQKSIFITLLISTILILFLFIFIKRLILNPISKIINNISHQDAMGIPLRSNLVKGSKEIELLSSSLNNMIDTIANSKKEILKLNERFELTLDAVKDGIWDWDLKTNQVFFSKSWKTMLGYQEDELENTAEMFFNLIAEKDQKMVKTALDLHFQNPNQNPYNIELQLRCKDGTYKWILSRGNVVLDEKGKPLRMLGFHSDITEQKEQEKRKIEQEKIIQEQMRLVSMGEMIGNIAHQWRQPLSVITTSASGLQMKSKFQKITEDDIEKFSDLIVQQAQYLSKTIDNFRNFIKGDDLCEATSIKTAIEQTLSLINAALKNNYINLILDIDYDLKINGNINELIEAFMNIINNSKDVLKEKVSLEEDRLLFISTKKIDNKTIEITIKDSGGGIDESIINRIFEPYFTTKHQSVGTGLGLSISHQIIQDRHQGSITVSNIEFIYNNKNYKGCCFTIIFTLAPTKN